MASEEKKVDVLILGAGLSGLAAAYQLSKKVPSLTFLVAEANDRVGGRTLTMHLKGPQGQKDAFDLGAHWVCRRQKDIMSLIEDLGIEYYPQNVSGMYWWHYILYSIRAIIVAGNQCKRIDKKHNWFLLHAMHFIAFEK